MGGSSAPGAPSVFGQLAQLGLGQAATATKLSKKQRQQFQTYYNNNIRAPSRNIVSNLNQAVTDQENFAKQQEQQYSSEISPLISQSVQDAETYASPAKKAQMIGAATGDVANSFDAARHSAQSDLESFGINPGATRYAGLDVGIRTQEAAQQAAAGTEASNYVDETARQLRAQAIGEGQALPQQATQAQTSATQAGYGASYTGASALSAGAQATGSPIQYGALGEQGLQNVANITQMGFQDQMAKYQADQSSMGGFGQLLGLGAGLAGHAFGFAKGCIVPQSAFPTAGKAIDDVPAKLTAGEFVMPEDAVRWMGEEKLHKMIAKAREARQAIPAQADTQIGAQGAQHLAKGGLVKKHPAHTNPGGFVRFVQQELAKQGYYNGKIDGVSGPKTQAA